MKDKIYGITGLGVSFLSAWGSSIFSDKYMFVSIWFGVFSLVCGIASVGKLGGKILTSYY